MRQLLVILVLGMMLLSGCTEPADPDPDEDDDGRNELVGDNQATSGGQDPLIPGFDIAVGTGTYWEFFWMETTRTTAQGSGTSGSSEWGKTRYTLGDAMTVNGIPLHPVTRSGDTDSPIPDWTHLGYHEDRLIGSTDGYATIVLFDAREGEWVGGGFFSSATGRTGQATPGHASTDLVDTSAYSVGFNHEEGGCTYYSNTGTICDDESHRSTTNEYYKPGIGPVAYTRSATSTFSGGGYHSAHEFETQVGLVETSLQAPDGWAPMGVPWTEHSPMPLPRAEPVVVEAEGKIYALGGETGDRTDTADLQVYDPVTDTWTQASPYPVHRDLWSPSAAAMESLIFAVEAASAGTDDPDRWAVYDTQTDTWNPLGPVDAPIALRGSQAVTIGPYLVFVGDAGSHLYNTVRTEVVIYDVMENEWTQGVPHDDYLPNKIPVAIGPDLYVLSSEGHYHYGLTTGEWVLIGEGEYLHTATVHDGKIHGFRTGQPVKIYDPESGVWSSGPVTAAPARGAGAVSLNGAIYLVGGFEDYDENYALGEVHRYDAPE